MKERKGILHQVSKTQETKKLNIMYHCNKGWQKLSISQHTIHVCIFVWPQVKCGGWTNNYTYMYQHNKSWQKSSMTQHLSIFGQHIYLICLKLALQAQRGDKMLYQHSASTNLPVLVGQHCRWTCICRWSLVWHSTCSRHCHTMIQGPAKEQT